MSTPILFIIFNRPDVTRKVFGAIRQAQPMKLFIAADGPRTNTPSDVKLCDEAREIVKNIDWTCDVQVLFRNTNAGCKVAVSSAITWFFNNVEEGIILEDDCLPSESFFPYCEQMLRLYKDDKRIMLISGYNKQNTWRVTKNDYFFSNLGGIWGWATWKRAWSQYDLNMKNLDDFINNHYFEYLLGDSVGKTRKKQILDVRNNKVDTWDYQWAFARHINSGMAIVPSKNTVKNIGFGDNATHTKNISDSESVDLHELSFPLKINNLVIADKKYDSLFLDNKLRYLMNRIMRFFRPSINK